MSGGYIADFWMSFQMIAILIIAISGYETFEDRMEDDVKMLNESINEMKHIVSIQHSNGENDGRTLRISMDGYECVEYEEWMLCDPVGNTNISGDKNGKD